MIEVTDEQLRQAYRHCFGTSAGDIVLKDLQNRCFKTNTTYTGMTNDSLVNEGKRQVLLSIESMMSLEGLVQNEANEPQGGNQ